ncbi:MAG: (deoxy)nucleoside triphosphate pyrophosphohydrolase [Negativicutes bacterium]|nr:(deoxy)nucleoside triphosphate pyrophosphohydrolase [Negativicutes bacterium]
MLKVTAAILTDNGKILIAQKGPNDKRANKWEFPGGKIDPGETPEQCLEREMQEEFQVQIQVGKFFAESLFSYEEGQILVMAYFCVQSGGHLTPTEHADYRWVTAQELNQFDFVPSDIPIAEKLRQEYDLPSSLK